MSQFRKYCLSILKMCADTGEQAGASISKFTDEVIDSAVLAGVAFFTSLTSSITLDAPLEAAVVQAAIASGLMFFSTIALRRGIADRIKK